MPETPNDTPLPVRFVEHEGWVAIERLDDLSPTHEVPDMATAYQVAAAEGYNVRYVQGLPASPLVVLR